MSTTQMNEMEQREEKIMLDQVSGKPQHIEVNERTLQAYKEEFRKKGLEITKHSEYTREDFHIIKKQKKFDSIVDPSKGFVKSLNLW